MDTNNEIVSASGDEEITQIGRRALPFAFAKRHGVLIREINSDGGDAIYRDDASPLSLAEARRFAGVPLSLQRVSADVFDTMLQESYEHEQGRAATSWRHLPPT